MQAAERRLPDGATMNQGSHGLSDRVTMIGKGSLGLHPKELAGCANLALQSPLPSNRV